MIPLTSAYLRATRIADRARLTGRERIKAIESLTGKLAFAEDETEAVYIERTQLLSLQNRTNHYEQITNE